MRDPINDRKLLYKGTRTMSLLHVFIFEKILCLWLSEFNEELVCVVSIMYNVNVRSIPVSHFTVVVRIHFPVPYWFRSFNSRMVRPSQMNWLPLDMFLLQVPLFIGTYRFTTLIFISVDYLYISRRGLFEFVVVYLFSYWTRFYNGNL